MALLSRNRQLLFAPEPVFGTAASLISGSSLAAGAKALRILNPEVQFDFEKIEDEAASPSAGRLPYRAGVRQGTVTFGIELSGPKSGTLTEAPAWAELLEACGMRAVAAKKVTIDAFDTGTVFKQGRTFAADGSNGVGRVLKTLYSAQGDDTLIYEDLGTDVDSGDTTLTLSDPGGEFDGNIVDITSQTPANAGFAFVPTTLPGYTLTLSVGVSQDFNEGDIVTGGTSGAVGRVAQTSLSGATKLVVTFLGAVQAFSAGETITRVGGGTATMGTQTATYGQSLTIGLVESERFKVLRGCRGTCQFDLTNARAPRINFTFRGVYDSVTDQGSLAVSPDGGATPPRFVGATIWAGTDGAFCPQFQQLTVDLNANPAMIADPKSSEGILGAYAARRDISGQINPLARLEQSFATYAKAAAATDFPLQVAWGTEGSGNAFAFQADRTTFRSANAGDRDGLMTDELPLDFFEYAGNDEFVFLTL